MFELGHEFFAEAKAAVKPRIRPHVVVAAPRPARTIVVRAGRGPC
jgi:hypothetical protein